MADQDFLVRHRKTCPNRMSIKMNEERGLTGWALAGVATVIGTLSTVVASFYKTQISDYKSREGKLEVKITTLESESKECKEDRETIRISLARIETKQMLLEEQVAKMQG